MPEMAGEVYSFVYIVKEAMEQAASADPKVLRDTLAKIKITSGRAAMMQPGTVEFTETGASKHVVPTIIQWQDGEVRTVFPVELTDNKIRW
jgi:branched-chain amino acid transport system substrate-binding protein